jgi:hypothetical protein
MMNQFGRDESPLPPSFDAAVAKLDRQADQRLVGLPAIGKPLESLAVASSITCSRPTSSARPFSTGLSWYDEAMGGGTKDGEVYGLLGPGSSFKTGGLIQLAAAQAKLQFGRPRPGVVVLATYGEPERDIRMRLVAHAARVRLDRYRDHVTWGSPLSTPASRESYEIEYDLPECEQVRLAVAYRDCAYLWTLDMSGTQKGSKHIGTGFVTELAAALQDIAAATRTPVRVVLVDDAKTMAVRHQMASGLPHSELRGLVSTVPGLLRIEVASQLDCCVWVAHALNASAGEFYGAALDHRDAAEARDFGDGLDYAFCQSKIDPERKTTVWHPSKCRRTLRTPARVMHLDVIPGGLVAAVDAVGIRRTQRAASHATSEEWTDWDHWDREDTVIG